MGHLEVFVQDVANDADDGHPPRIGPRRPEVKPPSNRILTGKISPRRFFVDDGHRLSRVAGTKRAAAAHWNSHQREVVSRDNVALDRGNFRRLIVLRAVDGDGREVSLAVERNALHNRSRLDARQLTRTP